MSQHTDEARGGGLQVCGESCVLRISHVTHIRVTCETHSSVSHGKGVSAVRRWGGREGERGG